MLKRIFFLSIFLVAIFSSSFASNFIWEKPIEQGISYSHIKKKTKEGPLHIHLLTIDLNNKNIGIKPQLAKGKLGNLDKTSNIALETDAIAAINGSFFATKDDINLPIGNLMIDKKLLGKSILNRTAIGFADNKKIIFGRPKVKGYVKILKNGKSIIIWGINSPRRQDETIIYTSEFGERTRTNQWGKEITVDKHNRVINKGGGNSRIPLDGYVVSLHGWSRNFFHDVKVGDLLDLNYKLTSGWENIVHAITGGPLLIENGKIVVKNSLKKENFSKRILKPNSRTAIGINENNKMILAVVDKRYGISKGSTYKELAEILKELGASYAMGLDGGGTSTMYIAGRIVNYPLNINERSVSNAIIITYKDWNISNAFYEKNFFKSSNSKLTKNAFKKIIADNTKLTPASYIKQPEDYGLHGIKDVYVKMVKPLFPELFIIQEPITDRRLSSKL